MPAGPSVESRGLRTEIISLYCRRQDAADEVSHSAGVDAGEGSLLRPIRTSIRATRTSKECTSSFAAMRSSSLVNRVDSTHVVPTMVTMRGQESRRVCNTPLSFIVPDTLHRGCRCPLRTPRAIRTLDLWLRRPTLYPAELAARNFDVPRIARLGDSGSNAGKVRLGTCAPANESKRGWALMFSDCRSACDRWCHSSLMAWV